MNRIAQGSKLESLPQSSGGTAHNPVVLAARRAFAGRRVVSAYRPIGIYTWQGFRALRSIPDFSTGAAGEPISEALPWVTRKSVL